MNNGKKRIVVIGGGLGAMTAVYTLSGLPDFEERYDITIYQLGWRLGGKGASGINQKVGYRIEEHGVHLWMGFYENAFSLMRKVYGEVDRKNGQPLATFDEAFKGQPFMIFGENIAGSWSDWQINFPAIGGKVGDGTVPPLQELIQSIFNDIALKFRQWLNAHKEHELHNLSPTAHHSLIPQTLLNLFHKIEEDLVGDAEHAVEAAFLTLGKLISELAVWKEDTFGPHITLIQNIKKWIWDLIGKDVENDAEARHVWLGIDLMLSIWKGILDDKVLKIENGQLGLDFDCINAFDYSEWLILHGADAVYTIPSPLVRSMYDGPFAFLKGDVKNQNIEAGTILRVFLRLAFTCKENFVWRMQAGMGDTIFAPMYENLVKRSNVHIKFFQNAKTLTLDDDGINIGSITFENQVQLKSTYIPLIDVNGLPCWPSEPLYDQLDSEDARLLQEMKVDLETPWTNWPGRGNYTLTFGKDFDAIILGASIESVKELCEGVIAKNADWKNMADSVKTVQTQAYQWWMNKTPEELNLIPQKLLSTYVEPVDTFSEMNQLLDREHWPEEHRAKYIAYTCGVLSELGPLPPYTDADFPNREKERVFNYMAQYFTQHVEHLMPEAYKEGEFRWEILIDLLGKTGAERLRQQYFRANINPSERYVLSVKGSSKFRLQTNHHGVENLFLTGDWIQNGLNAGFVEGAAVSGLLTARAVSGNDAIPIIFPEWDLSSIHRKIS